VGEILSQSEIDALLEAISTGSIKIEDMTNQERKREVKPFDFHHPNQFSKEQLRTLVMLHENLARSLTTSFSTLLRSMVRVQVVSIDQLTFGEFAKSLPQMTVLSIINMAPLEGKIAIEFPPPVAFAMVDRMLGGFTHAPAKQRELTEIEQTVIKQLIVKILPNLKETWQPVTDLLPSFEVIELEPLQSKIFAPADLMVQIALEIKIAETLGVMNICLPVALLEPIIEQLNPQQWATPSTKTATAQNIASIQQRLAQAQVQVTVELGNTTIKVRDLLNIEPGDIISLEQSVDALLNVKIGNQIKFKGSPGVSGSKMAIQIGQIVHEG
jgi:flagellar motor switch protein FliM